MKMVMMGMRKCDGKKNRKKKKGKGRVRWRV
jgi:hypothetical protein